MSGQSSISAKTLKLWTELHRFAAPGMVAPVRCPEFKMGKLVDIHNRFAAPGMVAPIRCPEFRMGKLVEIHTLADEPLPGGQRRLA